jgi:hypothetical protein
LKGEWVEAEARILDEAGAELGHRILNKKYGLLKRIGDFFSRLRRRTRNVIAIRPNNQPGKDQRNLEESC